MPANIPRLTFAFLLLLVLFHSLETQQNVTFTGYCTYYGQYLRGERTASGERLNPGKLTAAHKTLAYGTKVRVTIGSKSVVVRINDRGPPGQENILDVSVAAARQLQFIRRGRAKCSATVVA